MELVKYNIDIAALRETRFSGSGSLNDLDYSFSWSGKPEGERKEAGMGFVIKKDIVTNLTEMPQPVDDIIMTMRLPMSKDNVAASVQSGIPRAHKLLLIVDFNTRKRQCQVALGHGQTWDWKRNSNGDFLLAL